MQVLANGQVQRSATEWRGIIGRYRQSRLGMKEFCVQKGLTLRTFEEMSYWNDCPTTKPPARALEEFLATIDTGRAVAPNDPAIDAARHVLDSLVGKYPSYSRQHLADVSVLAHQLLRAQGVTISVMQFMSEVDRYASRCSEV